ncbi:HNH endonuclease signature motif containing protein [Actinoplanes sp. NBRC 101535]|uniref:HNH endonuclease signature motif containing protein n=1 Tax=Actinoplanes sp. NBRC 101535 TaxID=3032196 RepID=UPI0024A208F5|nr:HNH endonuclease signature motif containing protein [Actinoplanes sp. NBRC 101535]GLY00587.1 HNH endonuclease [Actinoplanes sp. NBRC 101535]
MREVVEKLSEAASACAEAPLWPLPDAELLGFLNGVYQAQQVLHAALLHAVREVEGRGIPQKENVATANMWMRTRLLITSREAGGLLAQARLLDADPTVDALVKAGEVNASQLAVISSVLGELPASLDAESRLQASRLLGDWAPVLDPVELRRAGNRILAHVEPDEGDTAEEERLRRRERDVHAHRYFTLSPLGDGRISLRGMLDAESAAVVSAALDPLCSPAGAAAEQAETGEARTPEQRRADALVEICRGMLAGGTLPENGGDRPQVTVTAAFDVLKGELTSGVLDDGEPVSASTVRRMACDARLLPLVMDGPGQVLDAGRTRRLVSGSLRQALVARDRGCTFPGCDRPSRWCDGHHVRPWSEGGTTDLGNVTLLCGYHHRVVHDANSGWEVRMGDDGHPEFLPPPHLDPARRPRRNQFHRRT